MGAPTDLYTYLLFCSAVITLLLVSPCAGLGLDTVREFLTREEGTIVFSLIERAKRPLNLPAYEDHACFGRNGSFVELFVRESEEIQAKAGRYQSQEEIPFFHSRVPFTLAPRYNFTTDLYPAAASVNVNDAIWGIYFNDLLPMLAKKGDDGNYAVTAASDLACLQALSRRINYGRYVAEVKFRGDQQRYTTLISSKHKDALMKLLTSKAQEDVVKRRVEKKAMVFGQDVNLDGPTDKNSSQSSFKVAPSVGARRMSRARDVPCTVATIDLPDLRFVRYVSLSFIQFLSPVCSAAVTNRKETDCFMHGTSRARDKHISPFSSV